MRISDAFSLNCVRLMTTAAYDYCELARSASLKTCSACGCREDALWEHVVVVVVVYCMVMFVSQSYVTFVVDVINYNLFST
jgi:hypothetical protein